MKNFFQLLLIVFSCSLIAQENNIQLVTDNNNKHFGNVLFNGVSGDELNGYSQAQLKLAFPVYFGDIQGAPAADLPSLLGTYSVVSDQLVFKPRFPFTQGKSYTAFNINHQHLYTFAIPHLAKPNSNHVTAIYPSSDTIPANLLKLYIAFEHPMQFGIAYDNIVLLNKQGDRVEAPFLEIEQELWDSERKLFTLWLDPGRIKRDLSPNQLLGNPLKENYEYQLVLKKNWKDVYGNTLDDDVIKTFVVNAYDRQKPSEMHWRIDYPSAGTENPITLSFTESLDFGTLLNGFQLEHQQHPVSVNFSLSDNESTMRITPKTAWSKGDYQLFINPSIEDLAGNNLNRLFDTDLSDGTVTEKERNEIVIRFAIQ